MNKTILIILLVLSVLCGVYAEPVDSAASSNAKVSFDLKNEFFAVEKVGFTFDDNKNFISTPNDMSDIPVDVPEEGVAVKYDPKSGYAKNEPFNLYYKIKGAVPVTIKVGTTGPLANSNKSIHFKMVINDGSGKEIDSSVVTSNWSRTINLSNSYTYEADLIPIELVSKEHIDVSYVDAESYITYIVMNLSSN